MSVCVCACICSLECVLVCACSDIAKDVIVLIIILEWLLCLLLVIEIKRCLWESRTSLVYNKSLTEYNYLTTEGI